MRLHSDEDKAYMLAAPEVAVAAEAEVSRREENIVAAAALGTSIPAAEQTAVIAVVAAEVGTIDFESQCSYPAELLEGARIELVGMPPGDQA